MRDASFVRLQEHERAGRRVELLAGRREPRLAAQDEIELLMRIPVLLDDEVALARAVVGVDPERVDVERMANGLPLELTVLERRYRFDLVDVDPLQEVISRRSSSTTGSISSRPSTRSSRFQLAAQRSNAGSRSPS